MVWWLNSPIVMMVMMLICTLGGGSYCTATIHCLLCFSFAVEEKERIFLHAPSLLRSKGPVMITSPFQTPKHQQDITVVGWPQKITLEHFLLSFSCGKEKSCFVLCHELTTGLLVQVMPINCIILVFCASNHQNILIFKMIDSLVLDDDSSSS